MLVAIKTGNSMIHVIDFKMLICVICREHKDSHNLSLNTLYGSSEEKSCKKKKYMLDAFWLNQAWDDPEKQSCHIACFQGTSGLLCHHSDSTQTNFYNFLNGNMNSGDHLLFCVPVIICSTVVA